MALTFNVLLRSAGIEPGEVLLLRHQDGRATRGRTPYRLWRDHRPLFEIYQRHQSVSNQARFRRGYWASFVGAPNGDTLFVGLYAARGRTLTDQRWIAPQNDEVVERGEDHIYDLELLPALESAQGRLVIEWGPGWRQWVQLADRQDKPILELRRELHEPAFPGFAAFMGQLSEIETLPLSWVSALSASRGVYILTCPRTNEQYIGSAHGAGGFHARWLEYCTNGHGGNVSLKEP